VHSAHNSNSLNTKRTKGTSSLCKDTMVNLVLDKLETVVFVDVSGSSQAVYSSNNYHIPCKWLCVLMHSSNHHQTIK
jgi:hypothetical protein